MRRMIASFSSREIAVLGLIEAALSFAAIYAMTWAAGAFALLPGSGGLLPQDGVLFARIVTFATGIVALTIGLYGMDVCLDRRRLVIAAGLSALIVPAVLFAVANDSGNDVRDTNTVFIVTAATLWLAAMILIRLCYGSAAGRAMVVRRILLVGDPPQVGALRLRLRSRRGSTFEPVDLQSPMISWAQLRQHRIWGVIVASDAGGSAVAPLLAPLLDCKLRGLKVIGAVGFQEIYLGRVDLDALATQDLLLSHGFAFNRGSAVMKRGSDLVLALVMLLLALPLMAMTALAIKIDSRGPVLYRQQRVGQFGSTFTLFKFRSMTMCAEAGGHPRWAQKQDPRVTRVGRFIRATRIDELPQLANVILGEMSLVGPRPERPHFVEQLVRAIPFYAQRSYVKPGLTGWAQINFPYGASVEDAREKLAYDLYYVKHRSWLLDVVILIATIRVVVFCQGAR